MEEQFTVKGIHGNSTMNRAAYEEYQQALKARQLEGRYTLEEAAQYVADNSNANARSIFTKLEKSAETGELTIHWPGSDEVYKPKPKNPLAMNPAGLRGFEEAYWNDLNYWLEKKEARLDCEFPDPNTQTPETLKAVRGIDKRKVMAAFQGIKWDYDHWGKNLASPSSKLKNCRIAPGNKTTSALWNPADIALYLLDEGETFKKLDAVFVGLNDWADEWKEKTALERD